MMEKFSAREKRTTEGCVASGSGWSWVFDPVPHDAGPAVAPLVALVDGRVERRSEPC